VARKAAAKARVDSERLDVESRAARRALDVTRAAMAKRVVALYKAGEVGALRFVFASSTIPELMSRVAALETFVAYDGKLVDRYRGETAELEGLSARAKEALAASDRAAERLSRRSAELVAERAVRTRLLRRAREDRTQERSLLVELEKAARALEETVAALGGRSGAAERLVGQGFADRRGALRRPLSTRIAKPFGRVVDDTFRTETFRKGVEFEAIGGEAVPAVAKGVVRFAGWFRGYGRLVIVDQGDDYFTVMGHLDEIFVDVGDRVGLGDTLGTVGDTGSLSGPSLYFEIRRGVEPLDPAVWLRDETPRRADHRPPE
jgi:septal ring factor EnvC (AmiA/AmiB activator)